MIQGMVGQMKESFTGLKGSIDTLTATLLEMGTVGEVSEQKIPDNMA